MNYISKSIHYTVGSNGNFNRFTSYTRGRGVTSSRSPIGINIHCHVLLEKELFDICLMMYVCKTSRIHANILNTYAYFRFTYKNDFIASL